MIRVMITAVPSWPAGCRWPSSRRRRCHQGQGGETAAKAAWQAKVDAFLLCKAQDRVAATYKKTAPPRRRPPDRRLAAAPRHGCRGPSRCRPADAVKAAALGPPCRGRGTLAGCARPRALPYACAYRRRSTPPKPLETRAFAATPPARRA